MLSGCYANSCGNERRAALQGGAGEENSGKKTLSGAGDQTWPKVD